MARQLSVSRTALDTKTSEFVSARLGLDGVQYGHKGLYWFGQRFPYVQWILLLLVLPYTRVLIVGVQAFERGSGSQVSLVAYEFEFLVSEVCSRTGVCFDRSPPSMWSLLPLL
jgi:hypothetical protein